VATQTSNVNEVITRENPEFEAYRLGLLDVAKKRANKPVNIPDLQVAGMTPEQYQARNMAQQGLGAYQPYMDQAYQNTGQASSYFNQAPGVAQNYANQATQGAAGGYGAVAGAQGYVNNGLGQAQNYLGQGVGTMQDYASQGLSQGANLSQNTMNTAGGLGSLAMGYAGQGQSQVVDPARQAAGQANGLAQGGAQDYDPNRVGAFMNPYQELATQRAMAEYDRQAVGARQGAAAQAVKSGAFGGSRNGVMQAELERNLADVKGNTLIKDYANNYQQAQNAAIGTWDAQQGRQQNAANVALQGGQLQSNAGLASLQLGANTALSNQQTMGSLGMQQANMAQTGNLQAGQMIGGAQQNMGQQLGIMGLQAGQTMGSLGLQNASLQADTALKGGQLASGAMLDSARGLNDLASTNGQLGGYAQAYGQADSSYLYNMGAAFQKQNQVELDANYQNKLTDAYEPFQRINFMNDILSRTPSSQSTTSVASAPKASPYSEVVGSTIAGYGAINAYNKANNAFGS
jgi:hypothetical protein